MQSPELQFAGHLGADVRVGEHDGATVVNFDIGYTPRRLNDAGEWEDAGETQWLRVAAWRYLAERIIASGIGKGDAVLVVSKGAPKAKAFQKKDGEWAAGLEVTAKDVFVGLPKVKQGESPAATAPKSSLPPSSRERLGALAG